MGQGIVGFYGSDNFQHHEKRSQSDSKLPEFNLCTQAGTPEEHIQFCFNVYDIKWAQNQTNHFIISSLFSASRNEQISREGVFMLLRNCLSLKVPKEDGEESVKVQKQNNIKDM